MSLMQTYIAVRALELRVVLEEVSRLTISRFPPCALYSSFQGSLKLWLSLQTQLPSAASRTEQQL